MNEIAAGCVYEVVRKLNSRLALYCSRARLAVRN